MSRIRVKSVAPRKKLRVLEVGEEGSTTQFHPASTVIIPGYATDKRIDEILAGDTNLDGYLPKEEAATTYQALRGKGAPDGYVPLSNVGKIPHEYLNVTGFEIVGTYGVESPLPDPVDLEDGSAFVCHTDNYIDEFLPGKTSHSGDIALDIGDTYDLIPSTGTVSADQVIETENRVFVHPDHYDDTIAYIDAGDENLQTQINTLSGDSGADLGGLHDEVDEIKATYLPLSAGTEHKMTGILYMAENRIRGIPDVPDNNKDAINKGYVDAATDLKVSKSGDTMTGNLTLHNGNLNVTGSGGNINAVIHTGGDIDGKIINASGKINANSSIEMHDTKITGLGYPSADDDATTKGSVRDSFQARNLTDNAKPETIRSGSTYMPIQEWHGFDNSAEGSRAWKARVMANGDVQSLYTNPSDTSFVTKAYVDANSGGGGGEVFDGGTINNTLILASPNRDIDVANGVAGELKYNGTSKFKWGSGKNTSNQELVMNGHHITDLGSPTNPQDAANKGYVDSKSGVLQSEIDSALVEQGTIKGQISDALVVQAELQAADSADHDWTGQNDYVGGKVTFDNEDGPVTFDGFKSDTSGDNTKAWMKFLQNSTPTHYTYFGPTSDFWEMRWSLGTAKMTFAQYATSTAAVEISKDGLAMHGNKISDVGTPTSDTDAATKAYVDDNIGGPDGVDHSIYLDKTNESQQELAGNLKMNGYGYVIYNGGNSTSLVNRGGIETLISTTPGLWEGGTVVEPIVLNSDDRDIDVTSGIAGQLKYAGTPKFRWGSGKNFSNQELDMENNKISGLSTPTTSQDAVTKMYCDANSGGGACTPGKLFKMRSSGTDYYDLNAGEFQMTTTNNAAWTGTLANAAFLSFCYEDLDGHDWRMGAQGNYAFPTGFIQVYNSTSMLGWWLYESWDTPLGFADYSTIGGVIIAVKSWVPTSNTTTLPSNGEFRLSSPFWN